MIDRRLDPPQSRARALCLDLSAVELFHLPARHRENALVRPDEPKTFSGQLYSLAEETGLPTVLLTGGREIEGIEDLDALPGQVMVPAFPQEVTQRGSLAASYEVLLTRLKIEPNDLLCITDQDPHLLSHLGLRTCRLDDAVEGLGTYSLQFRQGALTGSIPMTSEVAHTALVPLDLAIGSMDDPHAILECGYRVFDTVLLIDDFVPLEGFATKFLQKLVSGYAPVLYAQSDTLMAREPTYTTPLKMLRSAGCRRIIVTSSSGQMNAASHALLELASSFGFVVELLSWRHLIKAGGSVGYA